MTANGKLKLVLCTMLGLAAHWANGAGSASDLDYFQDFPVVLSASRLQQPLSAIMQLL